jgi:4-amino-4-deoxy-L-arabinose transferase-like glycosyltransferase
MNHKQTPISAQTSSAVAGWKVHDSFVLLFITLLALMIRLPYWQTIPPAGDETTQAIVALRIAQGHEFPLVGNDAYAGPFFFYILAFLFRLGVADPMVGRTVMLIAGTLTVTITYAWVHRLGKSRTASFIAAGLVAVNPHLVLLNSHPGGTTFLLPFFTTLFLWLLTSAVDLDHRGWLIASAIAAGLAIQTNPLAALLVAGGLVWAAFRVRHFPRLGKYWPLWLVVGGLAVALVYSPVIIYNVVSRLNSLDILQERSYLWEAHPTTYTFLNNERRLAFQLVRQVSGVLIGGETFRTLIGLPLVYLAWMLAGLVFTVRRISLLPMVLVFPFVLILPYFSSHYGLVHPVRFTTLLTPVFAVGMGLLSAALLKRAKEVGRPAARWTLPAAGVCAVALLAYPVVQLFQYYEHIEKNHQSGRALLELSRQMVEANQGEPVYISSSTNMPYIAGMLYVPRAHLIFADIYQELLPIEQIIGRLYERPESAVLLLSDHDADIIRQVVSITPWPSAANEEAHWLKYGLYTLDAKTPPIKPDFVLTGDDALRTVPQAPVGIPLGNSIELIGYDTSGSVTAGETLDLTFYWRVIGTLPGGTYVGFVHLLHMETRKLVAQEDHVLGQEQYPVNAWQPNEVVVDHYSLQVPNDAAPAQYALWVGVYTWPDLVRLDVPGHPDDIIELEPVDIGQ